MLGTSTFDWGKLDSAMAAHPAVAVPFIPLTDVVERLQAFRLDLEKEEPIGEIQLQADFLLWDLCDMLQLSPEEKKVVLGESTYQRLEADIEGA